MAQAIIINPPVIIVGGAGILTEISIKRIEKKRRELFAIARENSKKIKEMPLPTSAKVVNNLKNKTF